MKITIFTFLSFTILLFGIFSCKKSNQNKLSNDWKITSMEHRFDITEFNGNKYLTILTTTEFDFTSTEEHSTSTNTDSETTIGKVNQNEFKIQKDGTWSRSEAYEFIVDGEQHNYYKTFSGTWSFVGKSEGDDLKKNERVIFNVLSETEKQVIRDSVSGEETVVYDDVLTYLTGEKPEIFVIKESKKNELKLEFEKSHQKNGPTDNETFKESKKLTLTPK